MFEMGIVRGAVWPIFDWRDVGCSTTETVLSRSFSISISVELCPSLRARCGIADSMERNLEGPRRRQIGFHPLITGLGHLDPSRSLWI